nr:hypothetical protein 5 [Pseudomonadaceae bacterium]
MAADLYRYGFDQKVSTEDIESALLLSIWGCEALHGESQVRLDTAHYFEPAKRACVIDAGTPVGRDFSRLFTGFIGREFGPDSFTVERVEKLDKEQETTA